MSAQRVEEILDAAYRCFARHGARRTTMDDIAAEAGLSRPAVYQYMRNKDDVLRRLCQRLFEDALERARAAAGIGDRVARLEGILSTKMELVLKLFADSPHHAAELVGEGSRVSAEWSAAYQDRLRNLTTEALGGRAEHAELLLAFANGLERDLSNPDAARTRLRKGIEIFVAGMRSKE
jgi:AcrR family transcriptional regulator